MRPFRLAALLALVAFAALPAAPAAAQPAIPGWVVAPAGTPLLAAPEGPAVREVRRGEILTANGRTAEGAGGAALAGLSQGDGPDLWAPAAALSPAPLATLGGTLMPVAGICAGGEPFWSARWATGADGAQTLAVSVDMAEAEAEVEGAAVSAPAGWRHGLLLSPRWTLVFEAAACPFSPVDGLVWGRGTLVETGGARRVFLGCCRPDPSALR